MSAPPEPQPAPVQVSIVRPPLAPPPAPPAVTMPPTIVFSGIKRAVLAAPPVVRAPARTPAPPREPARPRPRANAGWPAGTQECWRCEIVWDSGYRTSRFHAVVRAPGNARGRVSARSQAFRWLFDAAPQASKQAFVAAVGALDAALTGAGWRPVQPGLKWYARRYVWTGAEPPPLG